MSVGVQGRFLVNTLFPDTVTTAGAFDVSNRAIRLVASGLTGDDVVTIQAWAGANGGIGDGAWVDLFHGGSAIQMDALNTQRIFVLIGQYRAVYAGSADVRVYAQEDTLDLDGNIAYNFSQPYGAGGGGGGGFTLAANDTNSVNLTYSGTTSSGTLTADVKISPDGGNAVSIHGNGLFAASGGGTVTADPVLTSLTEGGTLNVVLPTTPISNQILLAGSTIDEFTVVLPDGASPGQQISFSIAGASLNTLTINSTSGSLGTFFGPANYATISFIWDSAVPTWLPWISTPQALVASDSSTVDITYVPTAYPNTLTADVKVSADAGNQVSAHSDGIFVPAPSGFAMPFSDETADFSVATSSHAYRVTAPAETTVLGNLPAATTAGNQMYIFECEGSGSLGLHPNGTDTINGANSDSPVTPGLSVLLYCNGVDGWSQVGGV